MAKTVDTTGFDQNRNSSDSGDASVPIRDQESELLQARIKEVVGDRPVRAFARDAKVGESSLRDYMEGRRTPKRPTIEKIAFEGRVSTEWLATGSGPKEARGVIWHAVGAGKTTTAQEVLQYAQQAGHEAPAVQINIELLRMCLLACKRVFGEDFSHALDTIQLEYAADFYNQLALLAHSKGPRANPGDFCKLEIAALADQLRLFVQMGWARKFPADAGDRPRSGPGLDSWS